MTETLSKPVWRIEPLERDDIPTIIRIGRAAFAQDRHTLMKMHEKGTNDPNTEMPEESAYEYFENPRVKMLKAVDVDGKIVGFTSWGMWNFNGDRTVCTTRPHLLVVTYGQTVRGSRFSLRRTRRQSQVPRLAGYAAHRSTREHHVWASLRHDGSPQPGT
jgi:hypothetical protein